MENFKTALDMSLKGRSLQQLDMYFSKTPDCCDELNKITISTLMEILKRDRKHGNQYLPVQCVLTCLQHFLDSKIDSTTWYELSEDISKLFDATFALSATYIGDGALVQKCTSLFTEIVEFCEELADDTIKYMMTSLLEIATAEKFADVRFEVLSFISVLLQKSSRELRREVVPLNVDHLVKLSDTLVTSGNYELQATTVEVLARSRIYLQQATTLFPLHPRILQSFSKYSFLAYDSECRLFLNEVNESLSPNKLVYSLPCMIIIVDNKQLKKPVDPLYTDFWVDFNSCPASISFYYLAPKGSSPQKETWDALDIPLDPVSSVTAKKSQCKAKNSSSILDAVKLEVNQSTTAEHVKIYLKNDELFRTMETNILKKVLKDKYQSEFEDSNLVTNTSQTSSHKAVNSKDVNLQEGSFINMSTNPELRTKITEKTVADDSEQGSPSPTNVQTPHSGQNTSASNENLLKTLQDSDSKDSDSFIHYMKKKEAVVGKEKPSNDGYVENEKNNLAKSDNQFKIKYHTKTELNFKLLASKDGIGEITDSTVFHTDNIEEDDKKYNPRSNRTTTTTSILRSEEQRIDDKETKYAESKNTLISVKSREEKGAKVKVFDNEPNNNNSIRANLMNVELEMQNKNNVVKQQNCNTNQINSKSNTVKEKKSGRIPKVIAKTQHDARISHVNNSQLKENGKSSVGEESVSRKRLYSVQNNDALILSSQDDILSVDVPTYKISKKESNNKPQLNMNRKNVTYSYVNFKENNRKSTKERNEPALYVDKNDLEKESDEDDENNKSKSRNEDSLKDQDNDFKYSFRDEKRLEALNRTPENTKSSNIFPTIYSDFSSSVKKSDVKKTYARKKQKRGRKRILPPSSSDSDSDYNSDKSVLPKCVETRRKTAAKKKLCGFADMSAKPDTDLIRDFSTTNSRQMEVEQVPFEERIETRHQKKTTKAPAKRGRPKNTSRNKEMSTAEERDKQVEQVLEDVEMNYKDDLADMDIMPSEPKEINPLGQDQDDWSLDVFINPPSQDKKLLQQATYKINDMVLVGEQCTLLVNNRMKKVHNLAHRKRETHISAFEYKVQSSISSVQTQLQRLETASETLASTQMALASTSNLLMETNLQLESEAAQIENAQKDLKKNLSQAEKTENSSFTSMFQGFGRYMRNIVLSLLQANQREKSPS